MAEDSTAIPRMKLRTGPRSALTTAFTAFATVWMIHPKIATMIAPAACWGTHTVTAWTMASTMASIHALGPPQTRPMLIAGWAITGPAPASGSSRAAGLDGLDGL